MSHRNHHASRFTPHVPLSRGKIRPTPTGGTIMSTSTELQERAINTIRILAVDGVRKANSGHPGLPMGAMSNFRPPRF